MVRRELRTIFLILFSTYRFVSSFDYSCFDIEKLTTLTNGSHAFAEWSLQTKLDCNEATAERSLTIHPPISNLPGIIYMNNSCVEEKCSMEITPVELCTGYNITLDNQTTNFVMFENETTPTPKRFIPQFTDTVLFVDKNSLKTNCTDNVTAIWYTLNIHRNSIIERIPRHNFTVDAYYFTITYPERCPLMIWGLKSVDYAIKLNFEYSSEYNGTTWEFKATTNTGNQFQLEDISSSVGSSWISLKWPEQEFNSSLKHLELGLNNRTCIFYKNQLSVHEGFHHLNLSTACNTNGIELSSCTRYNVSIRAVYKNCSYNEFLAHQLATQFNHTNDYVKNLTVQTETNSFTLTWSDPECSEIPVNQWIVRIVQLSDERKRDNSHDLHLPKNRRNKIIFNDNNATYGDQTYDMYDVTVSSCSTYEIELLPIFKGNLNGSTQKLNFTTNMMDTDIQNVRSDNVSEASFSLQWSIPKRCRSHSQSKTPITINGSVVKPRINCTNLNDTNLKDAALCKAVIDQSSFNITSCKLFNVTVGNKWINIYTRQGEDTEIRNFSYRSGSDWIHMMWQIPKCKEHLSHYEIQFQDWETCNFTTSDFAVYNGSHYELNITNTGPCQKIRLFSCTSYNLTIRSVYKYSNHSELLQKEVATAPDQATSQAKDVVVKSQGREFSVQWRSPNCSASPVKWWNVTILQNDSYAERTTSFICKDNAALNEITVQRNQIKLWKRILNHSMVILPCLSFQVNITPVFSQFGHGSSTSVQAKTILTETDITSVKTQNVTDTDFALQWAIPKECSKENSIFNITINGSSVNTKPTCGKMGEEAICNARINSSVYQISSCSDYRVKIGTTQLNVSTLPDKDIQIKDFNYSSGPEWVNIMWRIPKCSEQLSHYEIQFRDGESCKYQVSSFTSYNQSHYQLNITNARPCGKTKLSSCTFYNLAIRSVYKNSNRSEPFKKEIFTAPNGTNSLVNDVLVNSQDRGFSVQWKLPVCSTSSIQFWAIKLHQDRYGSTNFSCKTSGRNSYEITVENNRFKCQNGESGSHSLAILPCHTFQVDISPYYSLFGIVSSTKVNATIKLTEKDVSNQTALNISDHGFTLQWAIPEQCLKTNDVNVTTAVNGSTITTNPSCLIKNKKAVCEKSVNASVYQVGNCSDYRVKIGKIELNISTLPGVDEVVQNLTAVSTGSSDIQLCWKKSICQIKRAVQRYSVIVNGSAKSIVTNGVEDCENGYVCLNLTTKAGNQTQFLPCTNYTINLSPIYEGVDQSYEQTVNVTTKPDYNKGSIKWVEADNISSSSVAIRWKNPICPIEIRNLEFEINGFKYNLPSNRMRQLKNNKMNTISVGANVELNNETIGKINTPLQPCEQYSARLGTQYNVNGEIFWSNVTFNTMSNIQLTNVTFTKENIDSTILSWKSEPDGSPCNHTFEIVVKDKNGVVRKKQNVTSSPFQLGMMEYETNYSVTIRVFDSSGYIPLNIDKHLYFVPESSVANSILITIIIVLSILITIVVMLLLRERRLRRKSSDIQRRGNNCNFSLELVALVESKRHPIRLIDLKDTVEFSVEHEYEELKKLASHLNFSQNVATAKELKPKNRYINTLPYDYNRVILFSTPGQEYSDYINASYVQGFKGNKEFIAAQGPMPTTVVDFWRMIWEQHVQVIVMVTSLIEAGKVKCEKYWPDENSSTSFDDIIVEHINEQHFDTFVARQLVASKKETKRFVKLFHFTDWPDFGCPKDPESLISFVEAVRQEMESLPVQTPTIVHCSAGVGRTGTFIAMDWLMHLTQQNNEVDIFHTVLNLRRCRVNMVQTEEQYTFLHNCLVYYVKTRVTKQNSKEQDLPVLE